MENLTKGQIEDKITKKTIAFYVENLKSGPKEAKTYIIEDLVIIRIKGNLFPIEERLLDDKNNINLVKDIRKALHEITTDKLGKVIEEITSHKVISSHSDVSTKTGEMVKIFVLEKNYEQEFEK